MPKSLDPNSRGYTNALLEDMNEKIQIILEATKPIPEIQRTLNATFMLLHGRDPSEINEIKTRLHKVEQAIA